MNDHAGTKGMCGGCMVDALNWYAIEISIAHAERSMDILTAGLLRSAGRLT